MGTLINGGQFAQMRFHLGKAMDNGLTSTEATEIISDFAYDAGWPNAFVAVPLNKSVLESRAK